MEKYFVFIFLLFPQLFHAQADGASTEHNLRAGDELSREMVTFGGSETNGRDVVWDLQDMEVLEGDHLTWYTGADVAPKEQKKNMNAKLVRKNKIFVMGFLFKKK